MNHYRQSLLRLRQGQCDRVFAAATNKSRSSWIGKWLPGWDATVSGSPVFGCVSSVEQLTEFRTAFVTYC